MFHRVRSFTENRRLYIYIPRRYAIDNRRTKIRAQGILTSAKTVQTAAEEPAAEGWGRRGAVDLVEAIILEGKERNDFRARETRRITAENEKRGTRGEARCGVAVMCETRFVLISTRRNLKNEIGIYMEQCEILKKKFSFFFFC